MARDSQLTIRINRQKKETAEKIFSHLGITLSDAIDIFVNQSIVKRGFPFPVVMPDIDNLSKGDKEFVEAGMESIARRRKLVDLLAQ